MKLTIITAVLNQRDDISKTVKSVLLQKFTEFEYLIIDGFSSDGTYEYLTSLTDKRIKIIQQAPSGLYPALNNGIKNSTGEFIMILNAGDWYLSNLVLSSYIESKPKYNEILYSKLQYLNTDLQPENVTGEVHEKPNFMLKGCDVPHPTTCISRQTYENFGFYDETLVSMADYDLLLGLHSSGYEFRCIDLVSIAFAPAGISSDRKIILRESFSVRLRYCSKHIGIYYGLRSFFFVLLGDMITKTLGDQTFRLIKKIKNKYI